MFGGNKKVNRENAALKAQLKIANGIIRDLNVRRGLVSPKKGAKVGERINHYKSDWLRVR